MSKYLYTVVYNIKIISKILLKIVRSCLYDSLKKELLIVQADCMKEKR